MFSAQMKGILTQDEVQGRLLGGVNAPGVLAGEVSRAVCEGGAFT